MIVLIAGVKGGTGKSTLATNLAAHLAGQREDVILLDVDPQATAYRWATRRQEQYPDAPKVHTAQASGWVYGVLRDLAGRYSHIIIDSGGHASDAMKSAMLGAQVVYAPLRPSQADLETVGELVGIIRDRKVYRDALFEGVGVTEMTANKAVPEIQLLAQEFFNGKGEALRYWARRQASQRLEHQPRARRPQGCRRSPERHSAAADQAPARKPATPAIPAKDLQLDRCRHRTRRAPGCRDQNNRTLRQRSF